VGSTVRIAQQGVAAALPAGWDAGIYRRTPAPGETTHTIFHAATVPLPVNRGDYGAGVVELLGPADVFVCLLEFDPSSVGTPLFATTGLPGLTSDMFRPKQLQRILPGQAGVQRFFNAAARAFSLYVVVGSMSNVLSLTGRANQVIGGLTITGWIQGGS
jgi:hypothetical protein